MDEILFKPIAYIKSPFKTTSEIPRQSTYAADKTAEIVINEEYLDGLLGLENYSHIIVLFHFHKSAGRSNLIVTRPGTGPGPRGVFSTRSPNRPNGIGLSIVELVKIDGNRLLIQGVDMLDGTPVLDIKPYFESLNPS